MDDTTWIAENQNNMESILSIADDFYLLNNIKVNKEKSKLLVKRSGKDKTIQKLQLSFGSETIDITPPTYTASAPTPPAPLHLPRPPPHPFQPTPTPPFPPRHP